jgi:hypothetical protein
MSASPPKPEYKFTFGYTVREHKTPAGLVRLPEEVGASGVNFHDTDLQLTIDALTGTR